MKARDIYRVYFHGPAYQVVERAWLEEGRMIGKFAAGLPENHCPRNLPLTAAPRLIELCFQTAGLWEMVTHGRMGLPQQLEGVRILRDPETAEGSLYAIVAPDGDGFAAEVVDEAGNRYVELTGYRTVALPDGVDADRVHGLLAASA